MIAPVWALVEDGYVAYHATLALNALVMSLAAIPAYFLARLFVSRRASLLVAAMTVVVPSLSYTGAVLTENAFYPLFLTAALAIAHAVRRPSSRPRPSRSSRSGSSSSRGSRASRCSWPMRGLRSPTASPRRPERLATPAGSCRPRSSRCRWRSPRRRLRRAR